MHTDRRLLQGMPYSKCPEDFTSSVIARCGLAMAEPVVKRPESRSANCYLNSYVLTAALLAVLVFCAPPSERLQAADTLGRNTVILGQQFRQNVQAGILEFGRSVEP